MEKNIDNAGVRFPPPLVYLLFFIISYFLHYYNPLNIFSSNLKYLFFTVGIILIVVSFLINFIAINTFHKNNTTIVPVKPATHMVTNDIFSVTRNPMYLALNILYLGCTLLINSYWPLILFPIVFIIINWFVIKKEEAYLERKFGEEYSRYKSKVRRWL